MALGLKRFHELVDDNEGDAYLTDDELHYFLEELRSRKMLLAQVFRTLDRGGRGRLSSEQLRSFSQCLGFHGGDQAWNECYDEFAEEYAWPPSTGACPRAFALWAEDQATDEELHGVLGELRRLQRKRASAAKLAKKSSVSPEQQRAALVQSIFRRLKARGAGRVGMWEVYHLAELLDMAFERDRFPKFYGGICRDLGLNAKSKAGLNQDQLAKILQEEPLECDMEGLQEILTSLDEDAYDSASQGSDG